MVLPIGPDPTPIAFVPALVQVTGDPFGGANSITPDAFTATITPDPSPELSKYHAPEIACSLVGIHPDGSPVKENDAALLVPVI
jgi:hypothetical protein